MRPLRIVFLSPAFDLPFHIRQVQEPLRVQTLVPESSIEALHMTVLHWFSGLDMNDTAMPCSSHQPRKCRLMNSGP